MAANVWSCKQNVLRYDPGGDGLRPSVRGPRPGAWRRGTHHGWVLGRLELYSGHRRHDCPADPSLCPRCQTAHKRSKRAMAPCPVFLRRGRNIPVAAVTDRSHGRAPVLDASGATLPSAHGRTNADRSLGATGKPCGGAAARVVAQGNRSAGAEWVGRGNVPVCHPAGNRFHAFPGGPVRLAVPAFP